MSPNWFLNMASPILNVPVHLFFMSVLVGKSFKYLSASPQSFITRACNQEVLGLNLGAAKILAMDFLTLYDTIPTFNDPDKVTF